MFWHTKLLSQNFWIKTFESKLSIVGLEKARTDCFDRFATFPEKSSRKWRNMWTKNSGKFLKQKGSCHLYSYERVMVTSDPHAQLFSLISLKKCRNDHRKRIESSTWPATIDSREHRSACLSVVQILNFKKSFSERRSFIKWPVVNSKKQIVAQWAELIKRVHIFELHKRKRATRGL